MARHTCHCGDAITYYWRWTSIQTPRRWDLHPIVNNQRGPRLLVALAHFVGYHLVRSRVDFAGES